VEAANAGRAAKGMNESMKCCGVAHACPFSSLALTLRCSVLEQSLLENLLELCWNHGSRLRIESVDVSESTTG
jgi:hypothetical protein